MQSRDAVIHWCTPQPYTYPLNADEGDIICRNRLASPHVCRERWVPHDDSATEKDETKPEWGNEMRYVSALSTSSSQSAEPTHTLRHIQ